MFLRSAVSRLSMTGIYEPNNFFSPKSESNANIKKFKR